MREEGTQVTCADCNETFTVTPGEVNFLKERFGDDFNMPKRCKPCRQIKKQQKQQRR